MTWLAPGAFAAMILLAGPMVVHLLARRHARRLVFPATHFVRATQAAAVALRRPSDIGLLLLRLAIVASAVLGAAQPFVMTPWRLARWNARVSRAVVVDTSRSMVAAGAGGAPAGDVAARLADQEMAGVFAARRLHAEVLADGVERAVRWLRAAPLSRRELVVISDFQLGALDERALTAIPPEIGIRLIRAGAQPATRRATSPPVEGWRGGIWQATTTIDAAGTRVSWVRGGNAGSPGWLSVMASPADAAAAGRARRAATAFGVTAGDNGRRILVRFAGAAPLVPPAQPIRSAWIGSAALALRHSDLLRDAETGMDGRVRVSERDDVMVVDAPVSASALGAPAVVRAALLAVRPPAITDADTETATVPDADLSRWRRDAAPAAGSTLPIAGDRDPSAAVSMETDGRWAWALTLVLIAVEGHARRVRGHAAEREAHADAA
jgi:hypothetical protein